MRNKSTPPRQPILHQYEPLADPWDTPLANPVSAADSEPARQSPMPTESLDYPKRLPAHRAIARELLEDELKLKNQSNSLRNLDKVLAWLYWLDSSEQTASSMGESSSG